MWQQLFERYRGDEFTVVGLALDAEGIAPAKLYYETHGVTFPSLVDPDYATRFGAVPKTFFVNEYGVVQNPREWEQQLSELGKPQPVTKAIRAQWSEPSARLDSAALAELAEASSKMPGNLAMATQLGSCYLALDLREEAQKVLKRALESYDAKTMARQGGSDSQLLGQAYFQLIRCLQGDRDAQVRYATISYYLNPSIGLAKQIARIIAPDSFDDRPDGQLDDAFREATYRRLKRERAAWLAK